MITAYLIPILIILLLILVNGIFVAAEFALVTAPRPKLQAQAEKGSKTAERILAIISDPLKQNRYITTAQVGITIASLGLGMYGEHVIADWILSPIHHIEQISEALAHTIASVLSVSLLTYLHVVLGEMIPKSLALQTASQVAITLHTPLVIANKMFSPLVSLMNKISNFLIHHLGLAHEEDSSRFYTSGDIEFAVDESFTSGYLEDSDQLFIENILDLDERAVIHAITPRNQIHALSTDLSPEEIKAFICNSNKTRYPIYQETLDQIIGILHMKDLVRYYTNNNRLPDDITELTRPALYIPESLALNAMLVKFKQDHTQIAVVLDEYGGTLGIITLEDLIEEVVGEILDEFDLETPPIQSLGGNRFRVRGDVILEELTQHLGIRFPDDIDAHTIGGYIMEIQGAIPQEEDELFLDGMTVTVEKVQRRAVKFLEIEVYPEDFPAEPE